MIMTPRAMLIVLAAILAVACGVEVSTPYLLQSAESQPVRPELCIADEATRERIRNIMMESLDEALHEQIKHLFLTWLKDERGQPDRARVGARQAIGAHQQARKSALEWMPPICSG